MEYSTRASFPFPIVPNMTEYAERGYLNILDTNNMFLDYDTELDEDWFDLDFPKGSPVPRRRRRVGGKVSASRP